MTIALVFDTETTGLARFKDDPVSPVQPNLVQLGALLIDLETGREYAIMDLIVYPSSWEVPQEAALVHGISTGVAKKVGVELDAAVLPFRDLVNAADILVCHNWAFDSIIMRRASAMVDLSDGKDVTDLFEGKPNFCTMRAATPIVKKRGKKPLHNEDYKWPKLIECMQHLFNEGLEGAHNAIVDCRATARLLTHLVNENLVTLPTE